MARRFVSNKNESVRMFKNDFVEFFSHIHPAVPPIIFLPVTAYMVYLSIVNHNLSTVATIGLFISGLFIWTFVEYTLHRFVFHYQPRSEWGKRLHFTMHGVHHDYPNDSTRLVMSPGVSIPLACIFYTLFWLVFGTAYTPGLFAGLVFGYVCYDMIHYATHHVALKNGIGKFLRQYHLRHHFNDDSAGYGVSTPLWDYVFGTRRKK